MASNRVGNNGVHTFLSLKIEITFASSPLVVFHDLHLWIGAVSAEIYLRICVGILSGSLDMFRLRSLRSFQLV